jgi:hypothetical protein
MSSRQETLRIWRRKVLDALDAAMIEQPLPAWRTHLPRTQGWLDCDLPRLFKAIDAHVETVCARNGIKLED